MATNEAYFLIMVLGAFGSFIVAMGVATLQYKAWLRRTKGAVVERRSHGAVAKSAAPASAE